MIEIRNACELHRSLTTRSEIQHATWAWWAPGDSTRYRITFVVASQIEANTRYHSFLLAEVDGDAIILNWRRDSPWTPESFLAYFGERYAGWWAGIRPVLAAFNWTTTRPDDTTYDPRDADEIGCLLTEDA